VRFRVAILTAFLLCIALPPAGAQGGTSASLSGFEDGATVSGSLGLTAEGSANVGVRRLTMWVDGTAVMDVTPEGIRQRVTGTYTWDTTKYVGSPQISRNRGYEVRVRAVSNGGGEDEVKFTAVVNNAPTTPTGLSSEISGGSVTIEWAANPEPDIVGYRVERFYGNAYEPVTTVQETSFTETRSPGRYSYRVVAVRHSDTDTNGLASGASEPLTVAVQGGAAGGAGGAAGGAGGKAGARGGSSGGRGGGISVGSSGLPSGAALPNPPGLSGLPEPPTALPWGTYKKRLPYKGLPRGGIPLKAVAAKGERTPFLRVIPPDGLRWVAAGLLLLTLAGLARLLSVRIAIAERSAKLAS